MLKNLVLVALTTITLGCRTPDARVQQPGPLATRQAPGQELVAIAMEAKLSLAEYASQGGQNQSEYDSALLTLAKEVDRLTADEIAKTLQIAEPSAPKPLVAENLALASPSPDFGDPNDPALLAGSGAMLLLGLTASSVQKSQPSQRALKDVYSFQVKRALMLKSNDWSIQDAYSPDGKSGRIVHLGTEYRNKITGETLYWFKLPMLYPENHPDIQDLRNEFLERNTVRINLEDSLVTVRASLKPEDAKVPAYEYTTKGGKMYSAYYKENAGYVLEEGSLAQLRQRGKAFRDYKQVQYHLEPQQWGPTRKVQLNQLSLGDLHLAKIKAAAMKNPVAGALVTLTSFAIAGGAATAAAALTKESQAVAPIEKLFSRLSDLENRLLVYHQKMGL